MCLILMYLWINSEKYVDWIRKDSSWGGAIGKFLLYKPKKVEANSVFTYNELCLIRI